MGIEVHRRVNNCSSFFFYLLLPDSEASWSEWSMQARRQAKWLCSLDWAVNEWGLDSMSEEQTIWEKLLISWKLNRHRIDYSAHFSYSSFFQLMVFDEGECSLLQIRGSIPLFWEQPGVQVGSHKVKLRAFETSAPAYHRYSFRFISKNKLVCVSNFYN